MQPPHKPFEPVLFEILHNVGVHTYLQHGFEESRRVVFRQNNPLLIYGTNCGSWNMGKCIV